MKLKKTIIFPLFFILSFLIISSLFVNIVKATDYEWIQDSSFEQSSVLLNNADFEDGNESWTFEYPTLNFVTDTEPYAGYYHARSGVLGYSFYQELNFNLTVSDVTYISFMAKKSLNDSSLLVFNVYYTNDTFKWYSISLTLEYTQYIYELNDMQQDAEIYKIEFDYSNGNGWQYIDDVEILTYSGIGGNSDFWSSFDLSGYAGFTSDEANTGIMSGYIIANPSHSGAGLYQNIPYLSTDNITEVSLYAMTNSVSNVTVNVYLQFSGSGQGQGALLHFSNFWVNSTSEWTQFDYDLLYINDGKIVVSIVIQIYGGDLNSYVYIDDVSLKASVTYGISRFSWNTIPNPVQYTNNDFMGLTYQDYVFYCTVYDFDGNPTEEGIFTATITSGNLIIGNNGIITNGEFYFTLRERSEVFELQTEILKINTITPSGAYTFYIYVTWYFNTLVTPVPVPTPEGRDTTFGNLNSLVYFIIYFIELLVPALSIAFVMHKKEQDPVLGLIVGFMFSGMISYLTGMDIWVLIVCIIAIGVLLFGKRGGYV